MSEKSFVPSSDSVSSNRGVVEMQLSNLLKSVCRGATESERNRWAAELLIDTIEQDYLDPEESYYFGDLAMEMSMPENESGYASMPRSIESFMLNNVGDDWYGIRDYDMAAQYLWAISNRDYVNDVVEDFLESCDCGLLGFNDPWKINVLMYIQVVEEIVADSDVIRKAEDSCEYAQIVWGEIKDDFVKELKQKYLGIESVAC